MSSTLTTTQQQVLTLLAEGSTITDAATAVGIHRHTVTSWRRTSAEFQYAMNDALHFGQFRRAVQWHEQLQELGELAIQCLRRILTDEKTSPRVRLTASLAVLNRIMKPSATVHIDAQSAEARLEDDLEVLYLDRPAASKPVASAQEKRVEDELDSSNAEPGRRLVN